MTAYDFPILVDLSKLNTQAKSVIDRLNTTLSTFGISERMCVAGEVGVMTLSVDRSLTQEELAKVSTTLQQEFIERFPDVALRVGEPRRKSGKSSSQPTASE